MVFYSGISFFIIVFDFAFGLRIHWGNKKVIKKGQIFHYATFNTDHLYGYISILTWLLNIPVMIIGLLFFVVKANKILDFISTSYLLHLFFCMIYNEAIIFTFGWYMINFSTYFGTVLIAEYVCIRFE